MDMISRSPCEVSRFKYYGYIGQRQELLVTLSGLAKMEGQSSGHAKLSRET